MPDAQNYYTVPPGGGNSTEYRIIHFDERSKLLSIAPESLVNKERWRCLLRGSYRGFSPLFRNRSHSHRAAATD